MSEAESRFLSRWSRLKLRSRAAQGDAAASAAVRVEPAAAGVDRAGPPAGPSTAHGTEQAEGQRWPAVDGSPDGRAAPMRADAGEPGTDSAKPPPAPLAALDSLTPQSDFRPFMQAGIDATTRNSALKRLFADPHFNVMDGLDVYIDDYGKTEPIPPALMAQLKQLHSIGIRDDAHDAAAQGAQPPVARAADPSATAPQSETPPAPTPAGPSAAGGASAGLIAPPTTTTADPRTGAPAQAPLASAAPGGRDRAIQSAPPQESNE